MMFRLRFGSFSAKVRSKLTAEGIFSSDEFVKDAAECPDVDGFREVAAALHDLWRHVGRSPAIHVLNFTGLTSEPEVDDFHYQAVVDQDVRHLQVSVCKIRLMHELHTSDDLGENLVT